MILEGVLEGVLEGILEGVLEGVLEGILEGVLLTDSSSSFCSVFVELELPDIKPVTALVILPKKELFFSLSSISSCSVVLFCNFSLSSLSLLVSTDEKPLLKLVIVESVAVTS